MRCRSCNKDFNGHQRCPRILPCSHTVCSYCISERIQRDSKECPICAKNFRASSVWDFKSNSDLLEIQLASSKPKMPLLPPSPRSRRLEEFVNENDVIISNYLGSCEEAADRLRNIIQANTDVKEKIQMENRMIADEILTKMNDIKNRNEKKDKYLEEENIRFKAHLQTLRGKEKQLRTIRRKMEEAKTIQEAAPTMDETEELNMDIQSWIRNLGESLVRSDKTRQEIKINANDISKKLNNIQDILSSTEKGCKEVDIDVVNDLDEEYYLLPDIMAPTAQAQVTVDSLRVMNQEVRTLVEQGRVFAIHVHGEWRRHAKLSMSEDNELLLGRLMNTTALPPNVHTLKYSDVTKLAGSTPQQTFFELGTVTSKLGKIYIRVSSNSKRAKQFVLLCSGENGPSYANTSLLDVENKNHPKLEYVCCGDYESNNGTGGKPLYHGNLDNVVLEDPKPCAAGTIEGLPQSGHHKSSQFIIHTKSSEKKQCNSSFGKVEKGLSILSKAIQQFHNIKDVSIQDCGLVLVNNCVFLRKNPSKISRQFVNTHLFY